MRSKDYNKNSIPIQQSIIRAITDDSNYRYILSLIWELSRLYKESWGIYPQKIKISRILYKQLIYKREFADIEQEEPTENKILNMDIKIYDQYSDFFEIGV